MLIGIQTEIQRNWILIIVLTIAFLFGLAIIIFTGFSDVNFCDVNDYFNTACKIENKFPNPREG
jgi:hypothetical protein